MLVKLNIDVVKDLLEDNTCVALLNKEKNMIGCVDYDTVRINDHNIKFSLYDVSCLSLDLSAIDYFDKEGNALVLK